ncbi:MAG: hypothetical protein QM526_01960 [Alphaproteobacteria bacterium]|nr:hypothetical protein [Alphaproteobacteria bacterium]
MQEEDKQIQRIERSSLRGMRPVTPQPMRAQKLNMQNEYEEGGDTFSAMQNERMMSRDSMSIKSGFSFKKYIFFALIIILIVVVLLSTTFSKATVELELRTSELSNISKTFSATREPDKTGDLSFRITGPFEETKETVIEATHEEPTISKSTGIFTVYNANPKKQKVDLVARTRFKSSDGRLYRATKAFSIPAATGTGQLTPGAKDIEVVADEPGQNFNTTTTGDKYTLPGLAGSEQAEYVYGISKTPLTGGFVGKKYIVTKAQDSEARKSLREEIKIALQDKIVKNSLNSQQNDRMSVDNGGAITFVSLPDEQGERKINIKEKGTIRGISFSIADVASALSEEYVTGSDVQARSFLNQKLSIVAKPGQDIETAEKLSIGVSGSATLLWSVDTLLFVSDISGKNREEIEKLVKERHTQVVSVKKISIFPPWLSSVPSSRSKIKIVISNTNNIETTKNEKVEEKK